MANVGINLTAKTTGGVGLIVDFNKNNLKKPDTTNTLKATAQSILGLLSSIDKGRLFFDFDVGLGIGSSTDTNYTINAIMGENYNSVQNYTELYASVNVRFGNLLNVQ